MITQEVRVAIRQALHRLNYHILNRMERKYEKLVAKFGSKYQESLDEVTKGLDKLDELAKLHTTVKTKYFKIVKRINKAQAQVLGGYQARPENSYKNTYLLRPDLRAGLKKTDIYSTLDQLIQLYQETQLKGIAILKSVYTRCPDNDLGRCPWLSYQQQMKHWYAVWDMIGLI